MKQILLAACIVLSFPLISFAQIQKGNTAIGGNGGFEIGLDEGSGTRFFISPTYGTFLSDKFLLSGTTGFSLFNRDGGNSWSINVGPVLRYYLYVNEKLSPFVTTGINYYYSSFDNDFIDDIDGIRAFGGGGASFHLNEHITLDGMVIYAYDEFSESNDIRMLWGFSLFLDSKEN